MESWIKAVVNISIENAYGKEKKHPNTAFKNGTFFSVKGQHFPIEMPEFFHFFIKIIFPLELQKTGDESLVCRALIILKAVEHNHIRSKPSISVEGGLIFSVAVAWSCHQHNYSQNTGGNRGGGVWHCSFQAIAERSRAKSTATRLLDSRFLAWSSCRKRDTSSWLEKSSSLRVAVSYQVCPSNSVMLCHAIWRDR